MTIRNGNGLSNFVIFRRVESKTDLLHGKKQIKNEEDYDKNSEIKNDLTHRNGKILVRHVAKGELRTLLVFTKLK